MPSAMVTNSASAMPGVRTKLLTEYRRQKKMRDNRILYLQLNTHDNWTYFVVVCQVFRVVHVRYRMSYVRMRTHRISFRTASLYGRSPIRLPAPWPALVLS